MSRFGPAFDAAQRRWDGMSEDDVHGPSEVIRPEPGPHAIWWERRCAAYQRLAERNARRAALETTDGSR